MKDPAFLFYPGDYLRDTQCLSESVQVAYDRIMCEHMRNICITQDQLNFFTKRLTDDEKKELLMVLTPVPGGFQITWVAESIQKRKEYSKSRRENREGKKNSIPKDKNISKSYVPHMEIENEIENVNDNNLKRSPENFIVVDDVTVTDPLPILEYYEAQLNGTMKENGGIAWKPLVPGWFSSKVGEDFKDGVHVKNSFKKYYLSRLPKGTGSAPKLKRDISNL